LRTKWAPGECRTPTASCRARENAWNQRDRQEKHTSCRALCSTTGFWLSLSRVCGLPLSQSDALCSQTDARPDVNPKLMHFVHKLFADCCTPKKKRNFTVPHPLRHFLYKVTERCRQIRWTLPRNRGEENQDRTWSTCTPSLQPSLPPRSGRSPGLGLKSKLAWRLA